MKACARAVLIPGRGRSSLRCLSCLSLVSLSSSRALGIFFGVEQNKSRTSPLGLDGSVLRSCKADEVVYASSSQSLRSPPFLRNLRRGSQKGLLLLYRIQVCYQQTQIRSDSLSLPLLRNLAYTVYFQHRSLRGTRC
jgi:hypothetical protein